MLKVITQEQAMLECGVCELFHSFCYVSMEYIFSQTVYGRIGHLCRKKSKKQEVFQMEIRWNSVFSTYIFTGGNSTHCLERVLYQTWYSSLSVPSPDSGLQWEEGNLHTSLLTSWYIQYNHVDCKVKGTIDVIISYHWTLSILMFHPTCEKKRCFELGTYRFKYML